MSLSFKNRKSKAKKSRYVGKPSGVIQERVKAADPQKFGIVSIDCAKRRCKWMLCNFYGEVIVEPTTAELNSAGLSNMIVLIQAAIKDRGIMDSIVAIEMTGIYHKPVLHAFKSAGFDARVVHSIASSHFAKTLHPSNKTDDNDLEAIFHAAINGYGLAILPLDETYQALKHLARHRRRLVKHRARLQVQIRCVLHQTMPGYADLFVEEEFFAHPTALTLAFNLPSAVQIQTEGVVKIMALMKSLKIRVQMKTIERIVAWSKNATEQPALSWMLTEQWKQLYEVWQKLALDVVDVERKMAHFLVKTPYLLLLSVNGINVVSAANLAGEAGPMEHYASAKALTGRAGLFPSRYQSDAKDNANGPVPRSCNRKLRGAALLIAKNLVSCNPHYRGIAALMEVQKVAPIDRFCRIANRAMRMVFQLVGKRTMWRKAGVESELILKKVNTFHHAHMTPIELCAADLVEAVKQIPKSQYDNESKPLIEITQKKRGKYDAKTIADLLIPVLLHLGIADVEKLQSKTSEARSQ